MCNGGTWLPASLRELRPNANCSEIVELLQQYTERIRTSQVQFHYHQFHSSEHSDTEEGHTALLA